jgi:hypothetical protein
MLVPPLAFVSNIEIWAYGVASLAPSGDGIKDDFYGGRSHLSELQIASRLSFNSIRLGLEVELRQRVQVNFRSKLGNQTRI